MSVFKSHKLLLADLSWLCCWLVTDVIDVLQWRNWFKLKFTIKMRKHCIKQCQGTVVGNVSIRATAVKQCNVEVAP
jgi:hypothetical protein